MEDNKLEVRKSTVEKLFIRKPGADSISVMLEEFGPGQGKITITCFNDAWSYYWGAMGNNTTLPQFFCKASDDYLAGKLVDYTRHQEIDPEATINSIKRTLLHKRLDGLLSKDAADDLWQRLASAEIYDAEDLKEWF